MRGPTAAFGAVIALAVTIATQSAGASLMGTTGVLSSAITNAAFASLCSQAALSLANNDGNFGKAAKHLTTTDTFKSLATSVATAGLTETGLGRAAAGFTVDVATGKKIDEAALSAARVAVASTLQASVAKHIGAGGFDPFTKAALHGISGAGTGAMLSENAEEGAISGGLSSMVATTVANFIKEDPETIAQRVVAKAKAEGRPLTEESLQPLVQAEIKSTVDLARFSGAVSNLFTGHDVGVGIETATTAVINNCAQTLTKEVFKAVGGLLATTMAGGFLAKKQTEDILKRRMDAAPENAEWEDTGVDTEEAKPTVHATPAADHLPRTPGYDAVPEDLTRGHVEGFDAYEGPDTSVLHKDGKIPEFKIRKEGFSGKESAKNIPSWAKGQMPYVNEKGTKYAERLCDSIYGKGNYDKGPASDYNKLKKFCDRGCENPGK
ncbi:MAG: DUF637 domain-containing protein [Alphaproteobacteria bacterium]|nr:DUF637 domain-containing protein [Alphaproteobacteria bacterium]